MKSTTFIFLINALIISQAYGQPIPISCDGDLSGQLASATDIKTYTFTSQGNEYATIRMQAESGSFIVCRLELIGPNGQQVAFAEAPDFLVDSATIHPVKLNLPGQYLVKVSSADAFFFNDGFFGLSVQVLRTGCAMPVVCETSQQNEFEIPAQTDAFWWVAQPGDRFIFRFLGIDLVATEANFYNAAGEPVNGAATSPGRIDFDFSSLASPDTIFLLMRNQETFFLGTYGFALQRLRVDCALELDCGSDLSDAVHYDEIDLYSLPVQPGDRLLLRAKGNYLHLEFFHRDGSPWFAPMSDDESLLSMKQVFSEHDTLLVAVMRYSSSFIFNYSPYSLSVQMLRPDCAQPLFCDVPMGDSMNHAVQVEAFRFEVAQGEKILLRTGHKNYFDGRLEVYAPDSFPNPFWEKNQSNLESQIRFEMTLQTPGTWYALLMEQDGFNMDLKSTYGLSFHRLTDPDCGQQVTYNNNLSAIFEHPGIVDAYIFDGSQGDLLAAQYGSCPFEFQSALELYDEAGNRIDAAYIPVFQTGVVRLNAHALPEDGKYKLLTFDREGSYSNGDYGFSLQKVNPGFNAVPLLLNQPVAGSLERATDMQVHTFHAVQGAALTLDIESESTFDWVLDVQVYTPSGALLGTAFAQPNTVFHRDSLPETGTYTVLTAQQGECGTGNFELTLTTEVAANEVQVGGAIFETYPNPFSDKLTVQFELSKAGNAMLEIMEATGRRAALLANGWMTAGWHSLEWEGREMPPGGYFMRLCGGEKCMVKRVVLVK